MHLYLLDGGGAGLLYFGIFLVLIFTGIAILIEAGIMTGFKYNLFKKALVDSLIANLASLVIGFVLINYALDVFNLDSLGGFAAFFGETLVVELLVLYLLNKQKPFSKTLLVGVVMNLITYIILFLVFGGLN